MSTFTLISQKTTFSKFNNKYKKYFKGQQYHPNTVDYSIELYNAPFDCISNASDTEISTYIKQMERMWVYIVFSLNTQRLHPQLQTRESMKRTEIGHEIGARQSFE